MLKKIIEGNPNVIFNTIQYSKAKNEVYFYTNKDIDIDISEKKVTVIPYFSNLINKNIIYSDNLLYFEGLGGNIKNN